MNIVKETKLDIEKNLLRLYEKLGRTPTRQEYIDEYSYRGVRSYYKNWNELVRACNLNTNKWMQEDEMIYKLKELHNKLNRLPTIEEYTDYIENQITFTQTSFKSYENFLKNVDDPEKHILDRARKRSVKRKNKFGMVGISEVKIKDETYYTASISVKGKYIVSEKFNTVEEAKNERLRLEKQYWGKVYSGKHQEDR